MPNDPLISQGVQLHRGRKFAEAEAVYRRVLTTRPTDVDALLLLGSLLADTGRAEAAVPVLRAAAGLAPNRVDVRKVLTGPLVSLGRLDEAIEQGRQILGIEPTGETYHGLAELLRQKGDAAAAMPMADRAVSMVPGNPVFWLTRSRVLNLAGRLGEALESVGRAVALGPGFPEAVIDRGIILQGVGRLPEAIEAYRAGLKLAPDNVACWNNLGTCYLIQNRIGEAIDCLSRAADLSPREPRPRNNIGVLLKEAGRIDEALPHLRQAASLDPNYSDAPNNIGGCYATIGEPEKAIEAYEACLRINPAFHQAGSNALLAMLSVPGKSEAEILDGHLRWGMRFSGNRPMPRPAVETAGRRLRVGYVSPDFREHSIRYFFEPMLAGRDRSTVEVFCYADERRRDDVTDRLVALADHWHVQSGRNDEQLAELIGSHGLDVLVDLAGHTSDNRLLTLARRPAKVQVTYLGYPATTGLTAVDYRLTDGVCDPPGADAFYVEKLVRLPDAFFVYSDDPGKAYDPVLPADRNGFVTFGSFNSFTKINDETLSAWASILKAVPGSRLLMKAKPLENPSTRERVLSMFAAHGVAMDRLTLMTWVPMGSHVALLGTVDLMLDTFPYNGHTTTCQSLWMGAAVVSRAGESFRSRVGLTILPRVGAADFVASTGEEYVRRAIELGTDLRRLRELRPTWRERLAGSVLCDRVRFARNVEAAYRAMCAGSGRPAVV